MHLGRPRGRLAVGQQSLTGLDGAPERRDVDGLSRDGQPVAAVLGDQDATGSAAVSFGFEELAQMEDVGLDGGGEPARWVFPPQHVGELLEGHPAGAGDGQPGQDRALLTSPERYRATRVGDAQRAENRHREVVIG